MDRDALNADSHRVKSLVGRTRLVDSIVEALTLNGVGIWLVGEAGLGKSAVAKAVEESLESGVPCLRLTASRALMPVPFGALSPLLNELSVEDITSPLAIMRSAIRSLRQLPRGPASTPIVIVDDAHLLDAGSMAILSQLVSAGEARLFALSRAVPGIPGEIVELWREGLVTRLVLEALTMAEVHELCVNVLGSDILRSASAAFGRAAAGNPMFLLALIEQARSMNHLVKRKGTWMLSGQPPVVGQMLSDLIEAELVPLSSGQRRVLAVTALAEPLPLGILRQLTTTSDIDALEAEGIISVGPGPERLVGPAHPLYGEVARQRIPLALSRTLRRSIVELMDSEPSTAEGLLRYVSWALECGAFMEDRQLLRGANLANKLHQTNLALALVRGITGPKYRYAARVEMARAFFFQDDLEQARELLKGIFEVADDLKTITSAALLSAQLRLRAGAAPESLHTDAAAWLKAAERIATDKEAPAKRTLKLSRIGSRLLSLYASSLSGDYQNHEPELQQIAEDPYGNTETRMVALSLLGELLTATGRPISGAEATRSALEMIHTSDELSLSYYEFVASRYALSLTFSGRWDDMQELVSLYLEQSPQSLAHLGGTINLLTGLTLARQGLLHSALGQLRPAIEAFRESDPEHWLPLALGVGAYASSLMGEHSLAGEYAGDFLQLPSMGPRQLYLIGQAHTAAAQMVMGSGTAGRDKLRATAAEAGERGMISVQLIALELAMRLGDKEAARPLSQVACANDSIAAGLLYRFVQAKLAKGPDKLRHISEEALEARYFLIAADAIAAAISLLEAQGREQQARQFRMLLSDRIQELEGITLFNRKEFDTAVELTRRERIVAALVLDGRSNKDIAEALSVSIRTVEGHLYRIFAKLGISHRQDITAAHVRRRQA